MASNFSTAFTDDTSSDAIQSFFSTALLVRGKYFLIHHWPMMKKPLSGRSGQTYILRRYPALSLATTALPEGANPAGHAVSHTDVAFTILTYGDFIENSDLLILTQKEDVKAEEIDLLAQQMGETFDQIDRDVWGGATNVVRANGATLNAIKETPDRNDIDRMYRTLQNNKAVPFMPMIPASMKVGTEPIAPSYYGMCHHNLSFNIKLIDGFVPVEKYSGTSGQMQGEIGSFPGFRILSSPNGLYAADAGAASTAVQSTTGTNADVYSLTAVGKNAACAINLANSNGGVIMKGFGHGDDPLNRRATVGWKKFYVSGITNQNFLVEGQFAVSL